MEKRQIKRSPPDAHLTLALSLKERENEWGDGGGEMTYLRR